MGRLRNTSVIIMLLIAVAAAVSVMFVNDSCHLDNTVMCFLTMCAFILTAAGFGFLLASNPLLITLPADSGVSLKFRLERPPRS